MSWKFEIWWIGACPNARFSWQVITYKLNIIASSSLLLYRYFVSFLRVWKGFLFLGEGVRVFVATTGLFFFVGLWFLESVIVERGFNSLRFEVFSWGLEIWRIGICPDDSIFFNPVQRILVSTGNWHCGEIRWLEFWKVLSSSFLGCGLGSLQVSLVRSFTLSLDRIF